MRQKYRISEQFPTPTEEEAMGFPVFILQEYLQLVSKSTICPLLIRDKEGQILAFWVFLDDEHCWTSPISAPFSCPQFSAQVNFNDLLTLSCSYLKAKENKPVLFTHNPLFEKISPFNFVKISKIELNQFIRIDQEAFSQKLPQKRRKRKLRALSRKDYSVAGLNRESWDSVYRKNVKWRIKKGHENYISPHLMSRFKGSFPSVYVGFELSHAKKLIGSAFLVHVSADYIYLYSLIVNPEYDKEEPSLLLYEAIYNYAKNREIRYLDLGTSMAITGGIHKNIACFKKNIGGNAVRKYTFQC